jgi:hypothetical protein
MIVAKELPPLEQVKDVRSLRRCKASIMKELTRSIQGSAVVELNDAYFAPSAAEPEFPPTTARTDSDTEEPVHAPACRPQ